MNKKHDNSHFPSHLTTHIKAGFSQHIYNQKEKLFCGRSLDQILCYTLPVTIQFCNNIRFSSTCSDKIITVIVFIFFLLQWSIACLNYSTSIQYNLKLPGAYPWPILLYETGANSGRSVMRLPNLNICLIKYSVSCPVFFCFVFFFLYLQHKSNMTSSYLNKYWNQWKLPSPGLQYNSLVSEQTYKTDSVDEQALCLGQKLILYCLWQIYLMSDNFRKWYFLGLWSWHRHRT